MFFFYGDVSVGFTPFISIVNYNIVSKLWVIVFFISLVLLAAVLFGVVWSITGEECLPKGNLFGITVLFICAVVGGKLVTLIRLPKLPPFPPLLGEWEQSALFSFDMLICFYLICFIRIETLSYLPVPVSVISFHLEYMQHFVNILVGQCINSDLYCLTKHFSVNSN